jgi:hypothetical protein
MHVTRPAVTDVTVRLPPRPRVFRDEVAGQGPSRPPSAKARTRTGRGEGAKAVRNAARTGTAEATRANHCKRLEWRSGQPLGGQMLVYGLAAPMSVQPLRRHVQRRAAGRRFEGAVMTRQARAKTRPAARSAGLYRAKVNPHNLLTTNDVRRSCSAGPIQLTVVDRRTPRWAVAYCTDVARGPTVSVPQASTRDSRDHARRRSRR